MIKKISKYREALDKCKKFEITNKTDPYLVCQLKDAINVLQELVNNEEGHGGYQCFHFRLDDEEN